jgi:hypothetical protein
LRSASPECGNSSWRCIICCSACPLKCILSGSIAIAPRRLVAIPCLGGFVYGISAYLLWRWRPRDIVNAIEANALHGGRM